MAHLYMLFCVITKVSHIIETMKKYQQELNTKEFSINNSTI